MRYTILICIITLIASSIALTLFSSALTFASSERFPSSKPVLAYYYGWYTKNSWYGGIGGPNSLSVADVPSLGLYDSQNVSVIDTQITEALSAGIDGFIASWWGPGSFTDNTDRILMNQVSSKFNDFSVTLYFETEIIQNMNSSFGAESAQIVRDVKYIMQTYSGSTAFMEINRNQVLFIEGVDNWPIEFWSNVTSEVHTTYPSLLLIGDSFNSSYLNVFNGAASYVDLGYMTQSIALQNGTYPTFTDVSNLAKSEGKLWFAAASPGFNGTNDGKTQFPVVPREDGETLTRGWYIAQDSNPYGIIVGTWNEYYEGTSIEPTESYGNLYVQLTDQLSAAWRLPTHDHEQFFGTRYSPLEPSL